MGTRRRGRVAAGAGGVVTAGARAWPALSGAVLVSHAPRGPSSSASPDRGSSVGLDGATLSPSELLTHRPMEPTAGRRVFVWEGGGGGGPANLPAVCAGCVCAVYAGVYAHAL